MSSWLKGNLGLAAVAGAAWLLSVAVAWAVNTQRSSLEAQSNKEKKHENKNDATNEEQTAAGDGPLQNEAEQQQSLRHERLVAQEPTIHSSEKMPNEVDAATAEGKDRFTQVLE
ncbi:hypothetical protein BIW11_02032 [Tropilaelaps mercedesae]|uniref:Uncharacterized protein n=1 Tax=Tropilaelaps mercedesae TaxID=418985 RepID=A0A1V9X3Z4_9ACAR|nr:hypothetical protein BIW11_02032 [Tropilaelaps mercedesae]